MYLSILSLKMYKFWFNKFLFFSLLDSILIIYILKSLFSLFDLKILKENPKKVFKIVSSTQILIFSST